MAPTWLTVIAWVYIGICFICSGAIAYDIVIAGRRQPMAVMNWVFPITALYFGPFALALYWRWARVPAHRRRPHAERPRPGWASMAIEVSHCGSGCTVGDLISEWVIYALGLAIAGRVLFAEYVGDYVLAVAFGIVFQYFAIAPMRGLGVRDGLQAAAKADFISLTFFEIGLFGWMALMAFVFFPAPNNLMPNSIAFWFMMQLGMIIGFFTSWPANVWLVRRGIKVPM